VTGVKQEQESIFKNKIGVEVEKIRLRTPLIYTQLLIVFNGHFHRIPISSIPLLYTWYVAGSNPEFSMVYAPSKFTTTVETLATKLWNIVFCEL